MFPRTRATRIVVLGLVMSVFAVSAYAFTAQITFSTDHHEAGAATQTIGTYNVAQVDDYKYDAANDAFDQVKFDLDGAASDVQVALVANPVANDWTDCGATGASPTFTVTCDLTSSHNGEVAVADAVAFHVAAVSEGTVTPH